MSSGDDSRRDGNAPDDGKGEARLRRLFAATAHPPSDRQLDRLARAAARVVDESQTSWQRSIRWLKGPHRVVAISGLAAAAAASVALWVGSSGEPQAVPLSAALPRLELSSAVLPAAAGSDLDDEPSWADGSADSSLDGRSAPIVEIDPLSALDGVEIELHPDVGLDLLHPPGDDVDLETWGELVDLALEDS